MISPAVAKLDHGRALGRDDTALDLLVLDPLLVALGGLVRVLGREVLRAVAKARLEPIEERLMPRPVLTSALDLVEPRLVRGGPGDRRLVAVGLDPVPAAPSGGPTAA